MKNLGLVVSGGVLLLLFLSWMLFKGTDPVREITQSAPVLGWVGWGLAWACGLGGAALIARVITRRKPARPDDA